MMYHECFLSPCGLRELEVCLLRCMSVRMLVYQAPVKTDDLTSARVSGTLGYLSIFSHNAVSLQRNSHYGFLPIVSLITCVPTYHLYIYFTLHLFPYFTATDISIHGLRHFMVPPQGFSVPPFRTHRIVACGSIHGTTVRHFE